MSSWPVAGSRLADIGYVDKSGTWRTVLNILGEKQCRTLGIRPLQLAHGIGVYITQTMFASPREHMFVQLSPGWTWRTLTDAELQSCFDNAKFIDH